MLVPAYPSAMSDLLAEPGQSDGAEYEREYKVLPRYNHVMLRGRVRGMEWQCPDVCLRGRLVC